MAKINHAYAVRYKLYSADEPHLVALLASSKEEAYDKAVYEVIPEKHGEPPYSAWVTSVTYNNGNYKRFNTFEGKPY